MAALNNLLRQGALQDGKWNPKSLEDREVNKTENYLLQLSNEFILQLTKSEFKLPLLQVRPECAGMVRNLPVDEPPLKPPDHSASPYFMDNADPEKYLKKGKYYSSRTELVFYFQSSQKT